MPKFCLASLFLFIGCTRTCSPDHSQVVDLERKELSELVLTSPTQMNAYTNTVIDNAIKNATSDEEKTWLEAYKSTIKTISEKQEGFSSPSPKRFIQLFKQVPDVYDYSFEMQHAALNALAVLNFGSSLEESDLEGFIKVHGTKLVSRFPEAEEAYIFKATHVDHGVKRKLKTLKSCFLTTNGNLCKTVHTKQLQPFVHKHCEQKSVTPKIAFFRAESKAEKFKNQIVIGDKSTLYTEEKPFLGSQEISFISFSGDDKSLTMELTETGKKILAEKSSEWIGKPFLIMAGQKVVSAPIVQSLIRRGSLQLSLPKEGPNQLEVRDFCLKIRENQIPEDLAI